MFGVKQPLTPVKETKTELESSKKDPSEQLRIETTVAGSHREATDTQADF